MTIVAGMCDSYKREVFEGVHEPGDDYMIALYTSTAAITPSTRTYTPFGEATGIGYAPGGCMLAGFRTLLDEGTAILTFSNPTWPNASITACGALIYNRSKGNKALGVLDFASDVVSTNGPFHVNFPTPNKTVGLLRIF